MRAKRGPLGFILAFVAISVVTILIIQGIHLWLHHNHHLSGLIIFLGILTSIFGVSALLTQVIRRLNDMGWNGIYSLLTIFPATAVAVLALCAPNLNGLMIASLVVGALVLAPLCVIPGKSKDS